MCVSIYVELIIKFLELLIFHITQISNNNCGFDYIEKRSAIFYDYIFLVFHHPINLIGTKKTLL